MRLVVFGECFNGLIDQCVISLPYGFERQRKANMLTVHKGVSSVRIAQLSFFVFLGCLSTAGYAQNSTEIPLTFGEASRLLDAESELLKAQKEVLRQSEAELGVAYSRRWPELSIKGSEMRMGRSLDIDLDPVRGALMKIDPSFPTQDLPKDIQLQSRRVGVAAAVAELPLYTGGRISAGIDAAKAAVASEHASLTGVRGQLELLLVERYFAQVLAKAAVEVKAATLKSFQDHQAHAESLYREGQIPRTELLRSEVAVHESLRELEASQRDLSLAEAALASLLGQEGGLQPLSPIPNHINVPNLEPMLFEANMENPSLRAARERFAQAEQGVKAARGARLPSLALVGQKEIYKHNLDLYDPKWAVGVVLDWSVFDGGGHQKRIGSAQARADEVAHRVASGERDISLLVRTRYQQMAKAADQLKAFHSTRALALESLRSQKLAFQEGMATSLDVIDAQLAYQRVELGMLASRYEGLVAHAGLLEVTGRSQQIPDLLSGKE